MARNFIRGGGVTLARLNLRKNRGKRKQRQAAFLERGVPGQRFFWRCGWLSCGRGNAPHPLYERNLDWGEDSVFF